MKAPTQPPRFDPVSENPLRGGFDQTDLEPKPSEEGAKIDENYDSRIRGFKRELWNMAGVVKESRQLEGRILALVHISKEYKRYATDSEKEEVCAKHPPEIPVNDGLFLVLKTSGGLSFLGGRHADKMDPKTLNYAFRSIQKVWEFAMFSMEIEESLDRREEYIKELRKKLGSKLAPSA